MSKHTTNPIESLLKLPIGILVGQYKLLEKSFKKG